MNNMPPEVGYIIALGAVFLFAIIGSIIINRSLKQQKK